MNAHQIVARARNIPQVSAAGLRLAQLLQDTANGFDEASAAIKSDSLLTAKLLRACNSSALGFSEQIASVDQAFLLLGLEEVRRVVLSMTFGKVLATEWPGTPPDPSALRQHALLTAASAEMIAARDLFQGMDPAAAFTAGLLHDIGKVVIMQVISPEQQRVIATHMSREGLGSVEAEREVIGTDHAEVGACLLHIWRLPAGVVDAVAKHHEPVRAGEQQLSAVVHVANRIAHLAFAEAVKDRYGFSPGEPIVESAGLGEREQEELVEEARKSLDKARQLQALT